MGTTGDQACTKKKARRHDISWLPTTILVSMFASLAYLVCRIFTTLSAPASAIIWAVLLLEIATATPRLFTYLAVLPAALKAGGERLPRFLTGNDLPTVDVLVTYCGEGLDIISDTVKASCSLDYPPSLYRVVVLDDSDSAEVEGAVAEWKKRYSNLYYASRKVRVRTHSKAANLNFGSRYVEGLRGGRYQYVAVLDVDMIPLAHWLRAIVPHVHESPHVGLACPPQSFYNLPYNDPLCISYDIRSIHCLLHLQDYSNKGCCTGTGFVVSRSALDSIGGFPEESMQEDFLTSLHLAAKGWETVYLAGERVQWGLAPDTFVGWVKQRQRWAVGVISVAQYLYSQRAEGLAADVKFNGALYVVVDSSAALVWTVALVGLPALVATRRPLVAWTGATQLNLLLGLTLLDFVAQSAVQILLSSLLDFQMPEFGRFPSTWTAPYRLAVAWRYYVLPKLLGHQTPNFTPTNIPVHGEQERAARMDGSLVGRLKVILWGCSAYLHLAVLAFGVVGGALTIRSVLLEAVRKDAGLMIRGLMAGVGWPPLFVLWAAFLKNAWIPVAYAIWPPALLPREHFLVRDGANGAAYPSAQAKDDHVRGGRQGFYWFACLYYAFVFVVYLYA